MTAPQSAGSAVAATKPTRARWGILAILFIITAINYADRASISIAVLGRSRGLRAVGTKDVPS